MEILIKLDNLPIWWTSNVTKLTSLCVNFIVLIFFFFLWTTLLVQLFDFLTFFTRWTYSKCLGKRPHFFFLVWHGHGMIRVAETVSEADCPVLLRGRKAKGPSSLQTAHDTVSYEYVERSISNSGNLQTLVIVIVVSRSGLVDLYAGLSVIISL